MGQLCRVAQPPSREASDESEGKDPGQDVLEDPHADEVREERPEQSSNPPAPPRPRRLLAPPPPLRDPVRHGPLDLVHPTAQVAEEEGSEDREQERGGLQDERQPQSLLGT